MRIAVLLLVIAVIGCGGPTGPANTNTSSASIPELRAVAGSFARDVYRDTEELREENRNACHPTPS